MPRPAALALRALTLAATVAALASAPAHAEPPTVADAVAGADDAALYALDPDVHRAWGRPRADGDRRTLADWTTAVAEAEGVVGRVALPAADLAALAAALRAGREAPMPAAPTFQPRYGVKVRQGATTWAVLLCFGCGTAAAVGAEGTHLVALDVGDLKARLDAALTAGKVPTPADLARDADGARGEKGRRLSAPLELFGLSEPEALEVYGVDPDVYRRFGTAELPGPASPMETALGSLRAGTGVLRRATVTRASARKALADALVRGYERGGDPAKCWIPRHALVLRAGPKTAVVFVCFECSWAVAFGPKTAGDAPLIGFSDPGRLAARLDLLLEGGAAAAPAPAAAAGAFDVVLTAVGLQKLGVVKVVRFATGLGLKACKDLVESAPKPVLERLDRADADLLVAALAAEGATAEVRPAAGPVAAALPRADVRLLDVGPDRAAVVAALAAVMKRPAAAVEAAVATLPTVVASAMWRGDAIALAGRLADLGARAELAPVATPPSPK